MWRLTETSQRFPEVGSATLYDMVSLDAWSEPTRRVIQPPSPKPRVQQLHAHIRPGTFTADEILGTWTGDLFSKRRRVRILIVKARVLRSSTVMRGSSGLVVLPHKKIIPRRPSITLVGEGLETCLMHMMLGPKQPMLLPPA